MSKNLYGGGRSGKGNGFEMGGSEFGLGGQGGNQGNGGNAGFERPDKSHQTRSNNYAYQAGQKKWS